MSYPRLTFRRAKAKPGWDRTRYRVFYGDVELGEVYSLYTGGWRTEHDSGYATRYEAGYRLYTDAVSSRRVLDSSGNPTDRGGT